LFDGEILSGYTFSMNRLSASYRLSLSWLFAAGGDV
jgi:hypothetical protein